jgi:hypothetical protein
LAAFLHIWRPSSSSDPENIPCGGAKRHIYTDHFIGVYLEDNCHNDERELMLNIMMTVPLGVKIS